MAGVITTIAAAVLRQVRVHRSWQGQLNGKAVWFKQRRLATAPVITLGNQFFRAANAELLMIANVVAWREYEVAQWQQLYGSQSSGALDGRTLWTAALPGAQLGSYIHTHRHAERAFTAAGTALATFHQRSTASAHGDLHINNILFDKDGGRAHIIDFDTKTQLIGQPLRQGEDLAIFLLDLYRSVPHRSLRTTLSGAFLRADHNQLVLEGCRQRVRAILEPSNFLARIMTRLRIGTAEPDEAKHEVLSWLAPPNSA